MKAITRDRGPRIGPKLAQFLRFAFGAVFAVALLVGTLATGALEKPDGKPLRLRDAYLWAFGYPADDPDVLHNVAKPLVLPDAGPPPPPVVAQPPKPQVPQPPKDQIQFTGIVSQFSVSYGSAPNQAAQRKLRTERAAAICQQMKERTVTDWVGTVGELGKDPAGNGFLVIDLGGAQIGTAPNTAADGTNRTIILRDTVLSSIVNSLKPDQQVLFTADLFSDRQDCLKQTNAAAANAVTKPRFLVKFVNLKGF